MGTCILDTIHNKFDCCPQLGLAFKLSPYFDKAASFVNKGSQIGQAIRNDGFFFISQ
jgi:hypothetical protein